MPESKIKLQNVSKRYNIYNKPTDRLKEILTNNTRCYHREYWALKDFSYDFKQETTAILGPNGSGKSTLLQIIAGVLQPTTGTVDINGRITAILELGAGFQPEYTGRENALLNGMILGISEREMHERLDEIADFAEIGEFFDQPISTYSSGMVVRLAFACATIVDPDILLIDEALAVGDMRFEDKCRRRIKQMRLANKTIIFVSHNMAVVRKICNSAILLNDGKLLAQGSVEEVVPYYEKVMESEQGFGTVKRFETPAATIV